MGVLAIIARLVIAIVCSAAIGFERETAQKAAGLRTHTLVGVGSAIFSIVSIIGFDGPDQARIAAQIVTGIGFLGAGAILKSEQAGAIRGLTTAAGLWMTCAIGVTAGLGQFVTAAVATAVALIVLALLRRLERGETK